MYALPISSPFAPSLAKSFAPCFTTRLAILEANSVGRHFLGIDSRQHVLGLLNLCQLRLADPCLHGQSSLRVSRLMMSFAVMGES